MRLANPMVAEESALRAGLLGGLLGAVRYNSGHRRPWIRLFEVGDVFSPSPVLMDDSGDLTAERESTLVLPCEKERVALVLAREGDDAAAAVNAWRLVADALGIVGIELHQPAPRVRAEHDDESVADEELSTAGSSRMGSFRTSSAP